MKNFIFFMLSLFSGIYFGQEICGYDEMIHEEFSHPTIIEELEEKTTVHHIASFQNSPSKLISGCTPSRANKSGNYSIGITKVQLNNINNTSPIRDHFYVDYTLTNNENVYTDINDKEESSIRVEAGNSGYVKIWIDYNNNGTFETEEFLGDAQKKGRGVFNTNFTPPESAVKNTYLRMRVIGDYGRLDNNNAGCTNANYGQIEDYAVRIIVPQETPIPTNRVGINTDEPYSTLDIREVELNRLPAGQPQGVSFPNITTDQRDNFRNVKEGVMIYNITKKCLEIYKNSQWQCLVMSN